VHAAGLTLSADRVAEFRHRLNSYAHGCLTPDDFVPTLAIDTVVELLELSESAVGEIFRMAPFGNQNAIPVLVSRAVEVAGPPSILKEKHLRVPLRQGGRLVFMKGWNLAERAAELHCGSRVDIAFRIEEDTFSSARGNGAWAAILLDFRTVPAV
jgi:single-stranded-DNA-specific exonuclease